MPTLIETLDGGTVPSRQQTMPVRSFVKKLLSPLFILWRHRTVRSRTVDDIWQKAIPSELAFWDHWLATGGGNHAEDYRKRLDPNTPVCEPVSAFIQSVDCKILDVGAGPLTILGKRWQGHTLDITAVDPLGDEYAQLLKRHAVVPLVPTQTLEAEKLTAKFGSGTFDITNAQNCLDHSHDPVLAIEEMLEVTKSGGVVTLVHGQNEGETELYRGLHQWNFRKERDDFLIASPGLPTINISRRLSAKAEIIAFVRPSDEALVVILKKF